MSLVIRVMSTPAFSSVKKSSDSRWRWANTFTRRSFMTQAASRPVTFTWERWASAVMTSTPGRPRPARPRREVVLTGHAVVDGQLVS